MIFAFDLRTVQDMLATQFHYFSRGLGPESQGNLDL